MSEFYVIFEPDGDFNHTTISTTEKDAIIEFVEVEAGILGLQALLTGRDVDPSEIFKLKGDDCLNHWPMFQDMGYRVGKVAVTPLGQP